MEACVPSSIYSSSKECTPNTASINTWSHRNTALISVLGDNITKVKRWGLDSTKFSLCLFLALSFYKSFCYFIFSFPAYFWTCVSLAISIVHAKYLFHSPFHSSLSLVSTLLSLFFNSYNIEYFYHLHFCSVSWIAVHFQIYIFNSFPFSILKEDDWSLFMSFSLKYKWLLSHLVFGWIFFPLWVSVTWWQVFWIQRSIPWLMFPRCYEDSAIYPSLF